MKKIFFLMILVSLSACKEERSQEDLNSDLEFSLSDSLIYRPTRIVSLLPQAGERVETWLAYATAQNQVESLKNATVTEIIDYSGPMVQIMEALGNTLPDSLRVPAVKARINVLLTKANVLHQRSVKKNIQPAEILDSAEEIIIEFDNFKIQLNELFIKTPEDFESELDRIFENSQEQDSLNSAEATADFNSSQQQL
ncbi:MAG TPA: hypothetical protein VFM60_00740 [Salinimicrobium sp.]|nr:hypothetical protein [Salinimicrobium sp.]